jgi:hypothetical protein
LVPASCGDDNFVWIGDPIKGSRLLVVVGDEAIDGGLKIDDAFEGAAPETPFCEDGEKAFDGVESQLAEVGVKWNVQRGCRSSQAMTLGCLWVA